jgi:hypothetical protein
VLILLAAGLIYLGKSYSAGEKAQAVLEETPEEVVVEQVDEAWITVAPAEGDLQNGLIFYPGARVRYGAYALLMEDIARQGVFCVLVHMPGNIASLDRDAAETVMEAYPDIKNWYIGGHSLGGVTAAGYAAKHPNALKGLFLLASYSIDDLSDTDLKALTVYGSEDGVVGRETMEEHEKNLPERSEAVVIQGGNHAGFGDYGVQMGDGEATISGEEQQQETARVIVDWILNDEEGSGGMQYITE